MKAVRREPAVGAAKKKSALGTARAFEADDLGLSFYARVPDAEVTIREFEELACERLKVLHAIDRFCGVEKMSLNDISKLRGKIGPELLAAKLTLNYPTQANVEAFPATRAEYCHRDLLSHFVLRLAFCKTREAREWLMRQEQRLFAFRFECLNPEAKEAFLASSGIPCRRFDEKQAGANFLLNDLQQTTADAKIFSEGGGQPTYERIFYELPFQDLHPSLIASRKVVLKGGVAYVPSSAVKLILAGKFKANLAAGLEVAFQGLPAVLADPRIGGFLRLLQDHGLQLLVGTKSNKTDIGEKLTLNNFEEFLARSFPPCMRRLVEFQREKKKHLKHQGRLQLRPFLKDAGFSYEDSMSFWRQELMRDREIDATVFDKNYAYDVDHTYGKKGHMQGQNAFGCAKIIGFPGEAAGQAHGCPFKTSDLRGLRELLYAWRLPEANINEVDKLVSQGNHYQLACIEYFKGLHPGHEGDGVGNSPMDFFRESCSCHEKKREKEQGGGSPSKGSPAKPGAQGAAGA